jgi:hypothetical protein
MPNLFLHNFSRLGIFPLQKKILGKKSLGSLDSTHSGGPSYESEHSTVPIASISRRSSDLLVFPRASTASWWVGTAGVSPGSTGPFFLKKRGFSGKFQINCPWETETKSYLRLVHGKSRINFILICVQEKSGTAMTDTKRWCNDLLTKELGFDAADIVEHILTFSKEAELEEYLKVRPLILPLSSVGSSGSPKCSRFTTRGQIVWKQEHR